MCYSLRWTVLGTQKVIQYNLCAKNLWDEVGLVSPDPALLAVEACENDGRFWWELVRSVDTHGLL